MRLALLLLHLSVIPALVALVICLPLIKRQLYRENFIHSDFEYYYNPLVIFKYIRSRLLGRQKLGLPVLIFMLAGLLILLECLMHQILRLLA